MEKHHYFVYILKCVDDSYYTGVTNDLNRRLSEHQSGHLSDSYTHSRRPVEVVFCKEFKYINDAIAFEKQVKGWGRKKKEAIINCNWELLHPLAECLNKTSHKNYLKEPITLDDQSLKHPVSLSVRGRPAAEDSPKRLRPLPL